jgi:vacuolar-type H+-ATPase subunit E/Vma4
MSDIQADSINEPITLTIQEIEPQQDEVTKYKRYIEAQRRANKKYRENNKEKFREISRNYYNNHKTDPDFQQRQREKSLKSYHKRKVLKGEENVLLTINI